MDPRGWDQLSSPRRCATTSSTPQQRSTSVSAGLMDLRQILFNQPTAPTASQAAPAMSTNAPLPSSEQQQPQPSSSPSREHHPASADSGHAEHAEATPPLSKTAAAAVSGWLHKSPPSSSSRPANAAAHAAGTSPASASASVPMPAPATASTPAAVIPYDDEMHELHELQVFNSPSSAHAKRAASATASSASPVQQRGSPSPLSSPNAAALVPAAASAVSSHPTDDVAPSPRPAPQPTPQPLSTMHTSPSAEPRLHRPMSFTRSLSTSSSASSATTTVSASSSLVARELSPHDLATPIAKSKRPSSMAAVVAPPFFGDAAAAAEPGSTPNNTASTDKTDDPFLQRATASHSHEPIIMTPQTVVKKRSPSGLRPSPPVHPSTSNHSWQQQQQSDDANLRQSSPGQHSSAQPAMYGQSPPSIGGMAGLSPVTASTVAAGSRHAGLDNLGDVTFDDDSNAQFDDELLLSEQAPFDFMETSFAEDLTTVMRPPMFASSSSSLSSLDGPSEGSPIGSPPSFRHRMLSKASTPFKQSETHGHAAAQLAMRSARDTHRSVSAGAAPQSFNVLSPLRPAHSEPEQQEQLLHSVHQPTPTIAEFDPLTTASAKDWMMTFDSPLAAGKSSAHAMSSPSSAAFAGSARNGQSTPSAPRPPVPAHGGSSGLGGSIVATPQQQQSLLDLVNAMVTPHSVPKFSQRDLDLEKQKMRENFEKEFDVAQMEIQELATNADSMRHENQKMKETLAQWEQAVKHMIAEKEKSKQQHQSELDALRLQLAKMSEDRDLARKETDNVSLKYKQLRVDVSDLKEIDEKQRQRIGELEKDLTTATQRFDSLREHAEAKLDEANVEIARVRASYEKELSALRAKLSRVEIQMQSLELNLQAKTQENVELTKICDDLVSQMERMAA